MSARLDVEAAAAISVVTLGELYYGAMKSTRSTENVAKIDSLAAGLTVLTCDPTTAQRFAEVKDGLRRKGTPLPENDVWIAAAARQHGLTLATRDAHFRAIDGLAIELW